MLLMSTETIRTIRDGSKKLMFAFLVLYVHGGEMAY